MQPIRQRGMSNPNATGLAFALFRLRSNSRRYRLEPS